MKSKTMILKEENTEENFHDLGRSEDFLNRIQQISQSSK